MSLKKECVTKNKKTRKAITLEMKHKILTQHESGMKVNCLASKFQLSHSTISTILKDKEKYLKEVKNSSPMQSTLIRKRGGLIAEMEKLLILWIDDESKKMDASLNQGNISLKALSIFESLRKTRGESSQSVIFNASKGWFDRFRKRAGWMSKAKCKDTDAGSKNIGSIVETENRLVVEVSPEDITDLISMEHFKVEPEISIDKLTEAFHHVEAAMKIFEKNDPNFERSSKVIRSMKKSYACYKDVYEELKRKHN